MGQARAGKIAAHCRIPCHRPPHNPYLVEREHAKRPRRPQMSGPQPRPLLAQRARHVINHLTQARHITPPMHPYSCHVTLPSAYGWLLQDQRRARQVHHGPYHRPTQYPTPLSPLPSLRDVGATASLLPDEVHLHQRDTDRPAVLTRMENNALMQVTQSTEVLSVPHRFLPDSGGIQIGRGLCQYCHSCGFSFQWNSGIPELIPECSPEFTGTECHRNAFTGIVFNL